MIWKRDDAKSAKTNKKIFLCDFASLRFQSCVSQYLRSFTGKLSMFVVGGNSATETGTKTGLLNRALGALPPHDFGAIVERDPRPND